MDIQRHLTQIASHDAIPAAHKQYIYNLKQNGCEPKVIYDIGACVLHWTNFAKTVWPNAQYFVFDAFDKAEFLYKEANLNYHIGVLSDVDGRDVDFYQNDILPGGNSYYREIGCQNGKFFPPETIRKYKTHKLDTIVKAKNWPKPDFVKIDVQGSETDVILGALETFAQTANLVVEMQHSEYNLGAPNVEITLPFIEMQGFKCVAPMFCNNGPDADYGFVRNTI